MSWLILWIAIAMITGTLVSAQDDRGANQQESVPNLDEIELPIIDREPFDRLHFDKFNGNRQLDIDPITGIEGLSPTAQIDPTKMQGRLVFTMPDYPGQVFAVQWEHLVKIERYVDLVIQESEKAMANRDFGTAFKTLTYLRENSPEGDSVRLRQLMDKCLYEDGQSNFENGQYSEALTAFEELYRRNPGYQASGNDSVLTKITKCVDHFVEQQVDRGEFERARDILSYVNLEYGARVSEVVERWRQEMTNRALAELKVVESRLDDADGTLAHQAVRKLMYLNPDLPETAVIYNRVVAKFPYVYVGVSQPATTTDVRRIENWAARRVGRLTQRWLMEYLGPGDEGGDYLFPNGRSQQIDDLGLEYRLQLRTDSTFGVPPLTVYEISNRLLDLADPDSPDYYIPWDRIIDTIEIEDENSVAFKLRYPHVRPEALLTAPFYPHTDDRSASDDGIYVKSSGNDRENVYELNPSFERPDGLQFPRLVERLYKNTSEATEALMRGELDIVDRVFPADIPRLKQHPQIEVRPYIIPTVHILIPNPRNEFMKSDHFRRALHFGINRELILKELVAGGQELDGFEVVSGPFPPGTDAADELSYAYDMSIQPREFSGQLCLVLSRQFMMEEQIRRERQGEVNPVIELPTLVLAHPDNDLINSVCLAIAQQWRALDIKTVLRKLPPGVTIPDDDNYDLLFTELQIQEPLVDAHRLFGRNGLVKMVDPTIEQALRQLDSAYSWAEVSIALRRVHEQSSNNLTILPLWQLVEHFAYRDNVFNIGNQLVFLYQNIDRWRITGQTTEQVSSK